ncbi:Tripartite motif containing 37 [Basidiobolus ranarum]|uniref:Tripartite motif containing 37 n=1 Tax=Basidiobolus ranarum TaxID=34480 RepID=A0ABR2W108_9FUNG
MTTTNATNSLQSDRPTTPLEEVFRCFICLGALQNAVLCPTCSKLCCEHCIKKWIREHRPECPHCRARLTASQLVTCRFIDDLQQQLEEVTRNKKLTKDICPKHETKISYYCKTCKVALCSDCAMFGDTHRDHEFERLQTIYEQHVDNLNQQGKELRQRLVKFEEMIKNVELRERLCRDAKSQAEQELLSLTRYYQNLLSTQLQQKQTSLFVQKAVLTKDKECLKSALKEIDDAISNCSWVELIQEQEKIGDFLSKIQNSIPEQLKQKRVSTLFQRDFAPTYDYDIVEIKNFSQLVEADTVYYSRPLKSSGVSWRLKVYTMKDDGEVYLSMFLELLMGSNKTSTYQYSLALKHPLNLGGFERKFSSDFRLGDCWGYNKFCTLKFLKEKGFVSPKDVLRVRYMVRAATHYQRCLDQKRYIKKLEKALSSRSSFISPSKNTSLYSGKDSRSSTDSISYLSTDLQEKLCTACKQPFVEKFDKSLKKWIIPNSIQISEKLYHLDCRKASSADGDGNINTPSTTEAPHTPILDKGKTPTNISRYESLPLSVDDGASTSRRNMCHYDIDTESQRPSLDPSFEHHQSLGELYQLDADHNSSLEEIPNGIPVDERLLESPDSVDGDNLSLNDLYGNQNSPDLTVHSEIECEISTDLDNSFVPTSQTISDQSPNTASISRRLIGLSFLEDSLFTQSDEALSQDEVASEYSSQLTFDSARSTPRRERPISMPNSLGEMSGSRLNNSSPSEEFRNHRLSAIPLTRPSHSDSMNRSSIFSDSGGPSASELFKRYLGNKQRRSEEIPSSNSASWSPLTYLPREEPEAGPSSFNSQRREILRMLETEPEESALEESSNQLQLRLDESFDILEKIRALTRSLDESQESQIPVDSPTFDVTSAPWDLESSWSDRES